MGRWQVKPIANGLSHQHFHLIGPDEQLVLRIYRQQNLPWLDAQHELKVLSAAASSGLAPELVYQSPDQGFFISRYVPHQPCQRLTGQQLIDLLEAVSGLPITKEMAISERYQLYLKQALANSPELKAEQRLLAVRHRAEQALTELEAQTWPPVPTFLDWHEQNLLAGEERLYLIDYEYACLTALPLELASLYESGLVLHEDWHKVQAFMENRYAQKVSSRQLTLARTIYLSLCYLWYLAHQVNEPQEMELLKQRLKALD